MTTLLRVLKSYKHVVSINVNNFQFLRTNGACRNNVCTMLYDVFHDSIYVQVPTESTEPTHQDNGTQPKEQPEQPEQPHTNPSQERQPQERHSQLAHKNHKRSDSQGSITRSISSQDIELKRSESTETLKQRTPSVPSRKSDI